MTTNITFEHIGLQTSIQDKGRLGYQAMGIPVGGCMDQRSADIANFLVGNDEDNPVLEITLMGPSIEIDGPCQIAITGADISPKVNGQLIPLYQQINITAACTLSFGQLLKGCRAYLAIGGKWQLPKWLGSHSPATTNPAQITPQNIIQKGSQISIKTHFVDTRIFPKDEIPIFKKNNTIRVLAGPEFTAFSSKQIQSFFGQQYIISNQSNRMGYRLEGGFKNYSAPIEMISSASLPGTIQVSNSGAPIVLLRDAPTTGGYLRIAQVRNAELNKIAQMKPGDTLRFLLEDYDP